MATPKVEKGPELIVSDLVTECYSTALRKGWYDDEHTPRTFGDIIALCHSELSEALEEYRNGHHILEVYYNDDKPDKPEGVPIELADVLIRIFDFCGRENLDISKALELKLDFNKTRPPRHGNKTI